MLKHLKNNLKRYIVIGILLIVLLGYFFMPQSFNVNGEEKVYIQIDKEIEGINCYYVLNEQEINSLVKILEKSKFYRGAAKPERMFSNKTIHVTIQGDLSPIITIYYDNQKTFVWSYISTGILFDGYYRISNSTEVRRFIENIVNGKITEFLKIPTQ